MAKWYFYVDRGQAKGPVEFDEIAQQIQSGNLNAFDQIFCDGDESWKALSEFSEFSQCFNQADSIQDPAQQAQWVVLKKGGGQDNMKSLILGLMALAITSVASARSIRPQTGVDTQRVRQMSQRINQRIQMNADHLTQNELQRVANHLKAIRKILNGDTQPPPRNGILLRGNFERASFTFQGNSLEQIANQCVNFYKSNRLGNVDDINVSVDFGPTKTMRNNSSYWKSAGAVCGMIISYAKPISQVPVSRQNNLVVLAEVENHTFFLKGRNLYDLNNQCERQHAQKRVGNVDDILTTTNFNGMQKKRNTSSYWKTAFEVCQQLIGGIRR